MKPLFFLAILGLALNTCAKKQETKGNQAKIQQDNKGRAIFKDPNYPITIEYNSDPNKMKIDLNLFKEENDSVKLFHVPPGYRLSVETDFSEANPDIDVLDGAYEIFIFKYEKDFRKHHKLREAITQEASLNGIPAIFIRNPESNYEEYCLLVPGVYNRVTLSGLKNSEKITREALKHFHWTQPIDTNSQKFKAWKAHIWDILKTPAQK